MGGQSLLWENSRCSGRTVTAVGGGSLLRWTTVILCYGAMGGWSLLWEVVSGHCNKRTVTAIWWEGHCFGTTIVALGRGSLLWEDDCFYGIIVASMRGTVVAALQKQ